MAAPSTVMVSLPVPVVMWMVPASALMVLPPLPAVTLMLVPS